LVTTLVNTEDALNSRAITQDIEDALTPAHFLCDERLTTLPSGTEPQKERNLTKAHQRTKTDRRLLEALGKEVPPRVKKLP
jgi:hypothetical protein